MKKLLRWAALVAACVGARSVSAAELPLVTAGRSDYAIVIPKDAAPAERRAGEELRSHLEQMSGVKLPVVTDDAPLPPRAIMLGGGNRYLDTLGVKLDPAKLGNEGFVLRTVGDRVVVAGHGQRGTMYGATTLLEKLGVRWLTPSITRIPKQANLTLPSLDEMQAPAFEYREPYFREALDKDWAARLKVNGNHAALDESTGGRVIYGAFCHTFDALVSQSLFATHPEYFPLVKGERVGGYTQRCLTNPDVLKISIERVREWMRAAPDATIFSVSQNDTLSPCECDACREIEQKYGDQHSAVYLWFVNQIGQAVEKEFPGKLIDTLAYQFTEAPPTGISPRPNVRVRLCPISVCEGHPYEQCSRGENVAFVQRLKGWASLSNELYVWHYGINFQHYLAPFPDERQVADSLRLYRRSGVRGVMFQGGYSSLGSNTAEMRSYVMAKLLWDPNANVDSLVTEWLEGVYGKAGAAPMRRWYDLLQARAAAPTVHMFTGGTNWVDLLTPDLLAEGTRLFAEAERLVAGDPVAAKQLAKAKLGLRYAQLVIHPTKGPELEQFLADVRAMGIGQLNEMTDVAGWEAAYRAKLH